MLYHIGLGSNLGDRMFHMRRALIFLQGEGTITARSSVYETSPVETQEGSNFYNAVIVLDSNLEPNTLFERCKRYEAEQGRNLLHSHNRPRTIDIDILLAESHLMHTPKLQIPHPRMTVRAFVLIPLLEIDPRLVHPATGIPFQRYRENLDTKSQWIQRLQLGLG